MRDAARVVDEKWATARAENLAGYAELTGVLEQTKEALQGVARANASAVLERDEEVETFGETFRAFRTETRARLAFCEKAAAWPENATRDFLADVREDKRVVAVLSLERIDEAHRAARPARRAAFRSALGALAADIDRAREADGERIRRVKERAEVWDKRLGIERRVPPAPPGERQRPARSGGRAGE